MIFTTRRKKFLSFRNAFWLPKNHTIKKPRLALQQIGAFYLYDKLSHCIVVGGGIIGTLIWHNLQGELTMTITVNGLNNGLNQIKDLSTTTDYTVITMYGGNDNVYGGKYADTISGGAGNDSLVGNGGNDLIKGETGNDTLFGGLGNDTLYGGNGDDVLYGTFGVNRLYGDLGNDSFCHYMGTGLDSISDNGGSLDILYLDVKFSDLKSFWSGSNLNICTQNDWLYNGVNDYGVIIENQALGGNYKIEIIGGSDFSQPVNFV